MHPTIRSLFLACSSLASMAAHAEILDIAWSEQGRFERRVTVAPGKFAEACGKLARADAVAWQFEASGPLNFNIHYHEGKDVRYPARQEAIASARGELRAALDQDYCWMWTNKSARPVELRIELSR